MNKENGFSILELIIAMTLTLSVIGGIGTLLSASLSARARQNRQTGAMTATQHALNIMSREIANSGYGLDGNDANGIVIADSNNARVRFRGNLNNDSDVNDINEDITYFYDATNQSIARYDRTGTTSVLSSSITSLTVSYRDYATDGTASGAYDATPSVNTGSVRFMVTVALEPVANQPNLTINLSSEVSLRNSAGLLNRY